MIPLLMVSDYATTAYWEWQHPFPTGNDLHDIWGTSNTDIFAVGAQGTILHYDGSTWSEMESGIKEDLWGVWGSSGEDVFVVGRWGIILHYDGTDWSSITSGNYKHLEAVWCSSETDIFAVGWYGTILHYNGSTWSEMENVTYNFISMAFGVVQQLTSLPEVIMAPFYTMMVM